MLWGLCDKGLSDSEGNEGNSFVTHDGFLRSV